MEEKIMKKMINQDQNVVMVKNLVKYFDNVKAVDDISFQVHPGEVFGLLGPNGAGKTTTIKMLLGLLEPKDGEISVFGLNPEREEVEVKRRLGYISEEPLIYKSLTPKELFNFIASLRELKGEETSARLAEYLESLGAIEYYNKLIATLSRGNKQKIQIIAALLHDPDLLIMDEPLAGLDAKSVRVVKEIIKIHTQKGGAVIFSTHIMEIAEELCDRIAIINKGKIVGLGNIDELKLRANKLDTTLEDIFLNLTEEDQAINGIIEKLRKTLIISE